jgi:hypothetical protein
MGDDQARPISRFREIGYASFENIVGQARIIYFSNSRRNPHPAGLEPAGRDPFR